MAEPIGALRAELSANSARFSEDMKKAREAVRDASGSMTATMRRAERAFGSAVRSLTSFRTAAIAAAGATGLFLLAKRAIETADNIAKTADSIGISTDALQEWRFVADRAGVAQEKFDSAMQAFAKRVGEVRAGTGALLTFLQKFDQGLLRNLQATDNTTDALDLFLNALADTPSALDRAALSAAAFGRGAGAQMVILTRDGAEAMNELRQRARDLGIVLSEDIVRRAEVANDELTDMGRVLGVAATSAALELMPAMRLLANTLTDPEFLAALQSLSGTVANIIVFMVKWSNVLVPAIAGLAALGLASRIGVKDIRLLLGVMAGAAGVTGILLNDSRSLAERMEEFADAANKVKQGTDDIGESGAGAGTALTNLTETLTSQNAAMEQLIGRYRELPATVRDLKDEIELENAAASANVDLTTQQGQAWADAYREGQRLKRNLADVERITTEIRTPTEQYADAIDRLNELVADGAINQDQYAKAVQKAKEQLDKTDDTAKRAGDAARDLGFTFTSAFEDAIIEGKALGDVLQGLLQDIERIILRKTILEPLADALTGSLGGLFRPGGGSSGGGQGFATIVQTPSAGLAEGGMPPTFQDVLVGEKGPELFRAGVAGTVIPNDALKGLGSGPAVIAQGGDAEVTVNVVNNSGAPARSREARTANGGREITVVIGEQLGEDVRRGGPLSGALEQTYGLRRKTQGR